MNTNPNIPRTDVGGGSLAGLLAVVLMMVLNGDAYDFYAVAGLFGAVAVALSGYLPKRHKNFVMMCVSLAAPLVASAVGYFFFGVQWDNALVSTAAASLLAALVAYVAPPNAQSEIIVQARDVAPQASGGTIARDVPPTPGHLR